MDKQILAEICQVMLFLNENSTKQELINYGFDPENIETAEILLRNLNEHYENE